MILIWRQQISRLFHQVFELRGIQIIFTEVVGVNNRETHQIYKKRYNVANKCELIERINDVQHIRPRLSVWK